MNKSKIEKPSMPITIRRELSLLMRTDGKDQVIIILEDEYGNRFDLTYLRDPNRLNYYLDTGSQNQWQPWMAILMVVTAILMALVAMLYMGV